MNPECGSMPWTPTKTRSRWTVRRAATANGPDQRLRRRPHAAGQDDRLVRAADLVEDVGDAGRVGDDGQARDVGEPLRERVGRGARGDADRHPRLDEGDGRVGDRVLLGLLHRGLRGEPGLEEGAAPRSSSPRRGPSRGGRARRGSRGRAARSCRRRRARGRGPRRGRRRSRGRARGSGSAAGAPASRHRPGPDRDPPTRYPRWPSFRSASERVTLTPTKVNGIDIIPLGWVR